MKALEEDRFGPRAGRACTGAGQNPINDPPGRAAVTVCVELLDDPRRVRQSLSPGGPLVQDDSQSLEGLRPRALDLSRGGRRVRLVQAVLGGVGHLVGCEVDNRSPGHRVVDEDGGEVGDKGIGCREHCHDLGFGGRVEKSHRRPRCASSCPRRAGAGGQRGPRRARPTRPRSAPTRQRLARPGRHDRHAMSGQTGRPGVPRSIRPTTPDVREPWSGAPAHSPGRARPCAARPGPRGVRRGGRRLPVVAARREAIRPASDRFGMCRAGTWLP